MTYGVGVTDEDTYPRLLETSLNTRRDFNTQVFNLAVPSYNTMDQAIYLDEVFEIYKPDLVILQYMVNNDANPKQRPTAQRGFRNTRLWQSLREIPNSSYLLAWLNRNLSTLLFNVSSASSEESTFENQVTRLLESTYGSDAPGWIEVQSALERIQRNLDQQGVPLLFMMNVNHIYLEASERQILYPLIDRITRIVEDIGIKPVLIMDDAFPGLAGKEQELFVRPDDAHWSTDAHELLAIWLEDKLFELQLLEEFD